VPPHRKNKQDTIKKNKKLDINNTTEFPTFNNQNLIVSDTQIEPEDKKDNISDYLKICMKTKEDALAGKLEPGWISLRRDKKTHKMMYSEDGKHYVSIDHYDSKIRKIHEEEEEEQYQEWIKEYHYRNEKRLWDDYELYGEESIMYQEYCRHQQYLEEYPDEDDIDNENMEDSGEDSGYD
jgi:hypothetical protein